MYMIIKHLHLTLVAVIIIVFAIQGFQLFSNGQQKYRKILTIIHHISGTLLLISGLTLAWLLGKYPFISEWVTVKLIALLAYIVVTSIALKRAKTTFVKVLALTGSLLIMAYIIHTALTRNPFM